MRNLALVGICASLFAGAIISNYDKPHEAQAEVYDFKHPLQEQVNRKIVKDLLDQISNLKAELETLRQAGEQSEEVEQPTIYYRREWQRTGRFGRGRWVNVPYQSSSVTLRSAAGNC